MNHGLLRRTEVVTSVERAVQLETEGEHRSRRLARLAHLLTHDPRATQQLIARLALGAILLLSAVLNLVQLDRVGLGNPYYAAAVKSMLESWHNFFFVSFDPGGFVSVDKPPLGFWVQTASAKLFGFSGISLLLPQAIAGVLSVWLLYVLVARVFGRRAGLLSALALAVTPVAVLVNRSNNVESILVLTMLLACWAALRAVEDGRLRWMVLAGVFLGLGFNVKSLEAYLAAPAIFLVYLAGARVRWRARIWHLALAGVVMLAISLAWVAAVDLTPAGQRPYVGSSGNNSELSLALGYNGLGRLTGNLFSFLNGGTGGAGTQSDLTPPNLGFSNGETGSPGIERLVNAELGGQASWLLLLAIIGFLAVAWQRRPRRPVDRRQSAGLLWGVWLATGAAFFSVAGFFHAYYLATLAPPIAALAGIGLVMLWRDYRRPGWRGWALPVTLVATAFLQAHILSYFPDWSGWLSPLIVGSSIALALALTALRSPDLVDMGALRPVALAAAVAGGLALVLAPSIWTENTAVNAGTQLPSAGPAPGAVAGELVSPWGGSPPTGLYGRGGVPPRGGPPRGSSGGDGSLGGILAVDRKLVSYLESHQGHVRFLLVTQGAAEAEPFILRTGRPVMALGGFLGDRILDVRRLEQLVSNRTVRYFMLPTLPNARGAFPGLADLPPEMRKFLEEHVPPGALGGLPGVGPNQDLVRWVAGHCRVVPVTAYRSANPLDAGPFANEPLYDCGH